MSHDAAFFAYAREVGAVADMAEEARVRRDECECNDPEYPERECPKCQADRAAGAALEVAIHALSAWAIERPGQALTELQAARRVFATAMHEARQ